MGAVSVPHLVSVLTPVVGAAGLDLEAVTVRSAGRRRLVRVVVDRDGGVDLDAVAAVSQAVSEELDRTDALGPGPYVLEVTSPGVDRPLTEDRHWRRALGRLVCCTRTDGGQVTGRLTAVTPAQVELEVAGHPRTLPRSGVSHAVVVVEFGGVEFGAVDAGEVPRGELPAGGAEG